MQKIKIVGYLIIARIETKFTLTHLYYGIFEDVDWRMVVLIKSSAGRPAIRELLRRTWAALSYVDRAQIASIFVIGIANRKQQLIIDEEVKRYGDILQLNVSDDYRFVFCLIFLELETDRLMLVRSRPAHINLN